MKKSILWNPVGCISIRGYNSIVEENDLKIGGNSKIERKSIGKTPQIGGNVSGYFMLVIFFLFTNFLFAQQPACNLTGILESLRTRDGGQDFVITSEVYKAVPGTVYRWEFKSNNSAATFVTPNGLPNMTIRPGNKNGEFNIKLTITNPPQSRTASSKTCSCTKSVSIGNN